MRTMLRWTVPVERGNEAIKDGSINAAIESLLETLKPEAAYFWPEDGQRSGLIVFDMGDASEIPRIAEPLFSSLDAAVDFTPVMNADDLRKGIAKAIS